MDRSPCWPLRGFAFGCWGKLRITGEGAYRKRTNYLLILNRLNTVEKEFLEALKGSMKAVEGASAVIAAVQNKSQSLRREFAERVFA